MKSEIFINSFYPFCTHAALCFLLNFDIYFKKLESKKAINSIKTNINNVKKN